MKKYLISALALGAMATNLNAECTPAKYSSGGGGVCNNVNITGLVVNTKGTLIATSGDEVEVSLECKPISKTYLLLRKDHPNYEIMHSTLLATQISGKKANIRIIRNDKTGKCNVLHMRINN